MTTTQAPIELTTSVPASLRAIIEEFQTFLDVVSELNFVVTGLKPLKAGEHKGHAVTLEYASAAGRATVTFSYLKDSELAAALNPDLTIGDRYHPARLARRTGYPIPAAFDAAARALQGHYFRVGTDLERLPETVTDCRLLFVRGNWHPQVANLTQGLIADLKWEPAS
ncbi:MAG TPA: hypothetical protein V6D17_11045 [Candidatus Obscuribacterales bacterium]